MGHTQRVGADHADAIRVHVTQALAETLEASDGACGHLFVDASVFLNAGAEANHLAQSIDDDELAMRITRNDHVKAVRTEVDGCEDIRQRSSRQKSRLLPGATQPAGEWRCLPKALDHYGPQATFGLWKILGRAGGRDSWTHWALRKRRDRGSMPMREGSGERTFSTRVPQAVKEDPQ